MTSLATFVELRDSLRQSPIGRGGVETCEALTSALDEAVIELAGDLFDQGVSVLATGGYGRREQCIYSDVDITILHVDADTKELARRILYPLWDAGLKVGHSIRTIAESNTAGKEQLETLTSQLSSRLIVGDSGLFDEFIAELVKTVSNVSLSNRLGRQEAERRITHPYQVMDADLKKGRGGLRTFQSFWWLRRREELLGRTVDAAGPEEISAVDTLLAVRNGLHAAAGRPLDRYEFEARDRPAAWLGSDVMTVSSQMCRALALGDRLAEQQWPGLLGANTSKQRKWFAKRPAEPSGGTLQRTVTLLDEPGRVHIVPDVAEDGAWPQSERDAFVKLISTGHRGRLAFAQLQEAGWVDREFPEWNSVVSLPQLAPFHEHPADAHLWRTADEMNALLETHEPLKSSIVAEVGNDDGLLLSAFLHDIGKGMGGDHSVLGAEAAQGFMSRVGYSPVATRTVAKSVRLHLLLIRTATRRDLAAPEVIDQVAGQVGDLRLLQMLYLLTIADNKATGIHMWSDWKETLLTQLYMRTAERLSGASGVASPPLTAIADLTAGEFSEKAVTDHLEELPVEYAEIMSASEIAWHMDGVKDLEEHTSLSVDRSGHRVLAVGRDRRGFLQNVCGAFAAHGIGIRDARIYTRADGIAIDTFDVFDDVSGGVVAPDVWPKVAHTLEQIEGAGFDVTTTVENRARAYDQQSIHGVSVTVRPNLSSRHLAIEVRSPDRVGLLADLVAALYTEGLDLQLARIDTRGSEAIDVIYLDPATAPSSEADLDALCGRIGASLRVG